MLRHAAAALLFGSLLGLTGCSSELKPQTQTTKIESDEEIKKQKDKSIAHLPPGATVPQSGSTQPGSAPPPGSRPPIPLGVGGPLTPAMPKTP